MATFSFDIVSDYDRSEINNVYDQTQRELVNRYDFKGTPAALKWRDTDKTGFIVEGNGDWQVEAIIDIIRKKMAARSQSQKLLDLSSSPVVSNMKTSLVVPFKQGLDQEKAKQLTVLIRSHYPKLRTQIQGIEVRVSGTSKDELQAVMQLLRSADFDFPLQFTNFR